MITNSTARPESFLSLQIPGCLRYLADNAFKLFTCLPRPPRMSWRGENQSSSSSSTIWRGCGRAVLGRIGDILWVAVIYLTSELLVWGLSMALRPVSLQFLSSIIGMILVFAVMVIVQRVSPASEGFYNRNMKSKIDFINKNLGLGFPVPIVTISRESLLGGAGIARVIGNFLNTNLIFWTLAFLLSWGILAALMKKKTPPVSRTWKHGKPRIVESDAEQTWPSGAVPLSPPPRIEIPPRCVSRRLSESTTTLNADTAMTGYHTDKEAGLIPDSRTVSAYFTDSECPTPIPPALRAVAKPQRRVSGGRTQGSDQGPSAASVVDWARDLYPIVLALFFFVAIGIPVSHATSDDRILDGCMLWFTWISSIRLQSMFGRGHILTNHPNIKTTTTTLLNPVLLTTLFMMAYTHVKSTATKVPLASVLATFSSGTPLSDLWTSKTVASWPLRPDQNDWFGAGDAALSILECGIVVWGFKLYECRRQIWSRAGAAVVLISVGIAAINVFVSVLLGTAVGLAGPEALAFAARSTTLALARPAMEALHGNRVVNAALVVSNGIMGQLMYPFLLRKLGLEREKEDEKREHEDDGVESDDALTISSGTAIGINGAAMGVAYLYERRSRAAPYAALSMTVFGVMTVVFTAVEPFTSTLSNLAYKL